MTSAHSKSRLFSSRLIWWSITAFVAVVGLGVLTNRASVQSAEILASRSPDGATYAVLLDVPRDAHGAHSASICLRKSVIPDHGALSCTAAIAYLSGVPANDPQLGVHLEWRSSTELEIRYREAANVYLRYPMFFWEPGGKNRAAFRSYGQTMTPIHTKLIHVNLAGNEAPAK